MVIDGKIELRDKGGEVNVLHGFLNVITHANGKSVVSLNVTRKQKEQIIT